MRYSLLLHYPEMTVTDLSDEAIAEGRAAFDAYAKALDAAGALLSAEMLQPSSMTTTISTRDGGLTVQNGPFADAGEQLAGTFVIDVADLDAALAWAEKAPSAQWGSIEIRPSASCFRDGQWHDEA